ncbi:zyxin-like isoform X2 [Tubulanus polymorphus]|uniref:zyxin-like isoform X2 n=1 Tax=Tubulanus polymorphus TaxID=672921 RepID=UPI003DA610EB
MAARQYVVSAGPYADNQQHVKPHNVHQHEVGGVRGYSHYGTVQPPQQPRSPNLKFNERYPAADCVATALPYRPGSPRGHSHLYPQRAPLEMLHTRYESGGGPSPNSPPVSGFHHQRPISPSSPGSRQIPVQHLDMSPRSPAGGAAVGRSAMSSDSPKMTPVKVIGSSEHQQIYNSASPVDYGKPQVPRHEEQPSSPRPYSPKPASSVLIRGVRAPTHPPAIRTPGITTATVSGPVITPQPATLTKMVLSQNMTAMKRPGDLAIINQKPKSPTVKEAEVDALTDLLIRNMEASSDPNYFGVCSRCGEAIVDEDSGCTALDQMYHVPCFACTHCEKNLKGCPFFAVEGKPFCEDCYLATLEKCSVCSKAITDRILRATGKPYHPQCFTCVVCAKSLDGIPFTVDATNQIHCIEDFHRKFAPRCHSCHQPIMPEANKDETVRIVAMDRSFHIQCYKCEEKNPLNCKNPENFLVKWWIKCRTGG